MVDYLKTKVVEYECLTSWLMGRLESLSANRRIHNGLIRRLGQAVTELENEIRVLQHIIEVNDDRIVQRALPIIHTVEFNSIIIACYYLPALQNEDADAVFMRSLLISAAKDCGLTWIQDMLVNLGSQQATISPITEMPIVFLPSQQSSVLFDVAGVYHEFGHNVANRHPSILSDMNQSASRHFSQLRDQIGPMNEPKRLTRDKEISSAGDYWSDKRIEEIFCDIFGTLGVGPAHFVSCVDLGIRSDRRPYDIDYNDEHPPFAARVYVSRKALQAKHFSEPHVTNAGLAWRRHLVYHEMPADYQLMCSDSLLNALLESAVNSVDRLLGSDWSFGRTKKSNENQNLATILNQAARFIWTKPDEFAIWQQSIMNELRQRFLLA